MENNETNENLDDHSVAEDVEINHSDKMIGVLTEPTKTFENISKFPLKTMDWLLPLFLLLVIVSISRIIVMQNDEIKYEQNQKQITKIENQVENGNMTREDGDKKLELLDKQMEFMSGPIGMVIQTVMIFIFGFVFFLIVSGIYYLFIKFGLKGDGTYVSVLVANGLTAYIGIISIIVATILSMSFNKMFDDVSVASFLGMDKSTTVGFLISKLDVFSIWAYAVLSIGLAKLFKSASTSKYYAVVFGLWIFGSLIIHLLGKVIPFFSNFN